jgi:hypothetical protein
MEPVFSKYLFWLKKHGWHGKCFKSAQADHLLEKAGAGNNRGIFERAGVPQEPVQFIFRQLDWRMISLRISSANSLDI